MAASPIARLSSGRYSEIRIEMAERVAAATAGQMITGFINFFPFYLIVHLGRVRPMSLSDGFRISPPAAKRLRLTVLYVEPISLLIVSRLAPSL